MPYLAKRLGVSIHTLYAWAYGKRTTPQHVLDKLEHIKKAQDEILGKDE
jgi:transcriptional regulator with XRE-family HTH domain